MERHEAETILDGDRETAVALLLQVGELLEANRRLEARVAELERRLNRSSRNSSLPPSQDPPSAPPRPRRPSSGRLRGGQPGHEGSYRALLPLERVGAVVEHWPRRCRTCAHLFDGPELVDAAEPRRHQVSELPSIAVRVSEHRLHAVRCPECAARTRAKLPRELPRSAFGPRLQAAVVTLAVRNRVSRRDTTELARELFGVELATGSVDAIVHRAGEALAAPHTRLEQQLKAAPVVNIDETGWKTAGGNRTLWGALTSQSAVFRIAAGRHGFEARTLLGERFSGIVCSDHWRGYDYLDPSRRQLCWAHLLRDFTAHSEGMGEQQAFGEDGLRIAHDLFTAWRTYQHDGDRARLQAEIAPLQAKLRALLEHAARKSTKTKYHRLFARNLLKRWPALWTFAHLDGVEPTNNHAERGLRGAVIYRKLSLGSQSDHGERTIERLLSASITCRLQRRSLSPTSPTSSAPRSGATPSPRSPDPAGYLNAYLLCCPVRRVNVNAGSKRAAVLGLSMRLQSGKALQNGFVAFTSRATRQRELGDHRPHRQRVTSGQSSPIAMVPSLDEGGATWHAEVDDLLVWSRFPASTQTRRTGSSPGVFADFDVSS